MSVAVDGQGIGSQQLTVNSALGSGLTVGGTAQSYDEVAVYDKVLNPDRLMAHYNLGRLADDSTSITSNANPATPGQAVTFTATVAPSVATSGTPSGSVTFLDGTTALGTTALTSGHASMTLSNLPQGARGITASYLPSSTFVPSTSAPLTQRIGSAVASTVSLSTSKSPSFLGELVTFTATVTSAAGGTATPGGVVVFRDGSTTLSSSTIDDHGVARLVSARLAAGSHTINAQYNGDVAFGTSNTAITQVIDARTLPSVAVTSDHPFAISGTSLVITASVTPNGSTATPTGPIAIYDGGNLLGQGAPTPAQTGNAVTFQVATSALPVGVHQLSAMFAGDVAFLPASSTTFEQTVSAGATTSTALSSDLNPSLQAGTVTFTARVAPASGSIVPTGTVDFLDGATPLGSTALDGTGNGSLHTTTLTPGTHTITARYNGDIRYAPSTSAPLQQSVTAVGGTPVVGDPLVGVVNTPLTFNGSASTPIGGIDAYSWDFGDNTARATSAVATHTYTSAGNYTATLRVTRSGITTSATLSVTIDPAPGAGAGLRITVKSQVGATLAGASVAVIDADGMRYSAASNSSGLAVLNGLPDGSYTAYAYKDGYKPETATVTVASGNGSLTITLELGNVAQSSLTSTPLAPDQLPAGLDPNDPANQNVYQFSIHLAFDTGSSAPAQLTYSGYATGDGTYQPTFTGGAGAGNGCATVGEYLACPTVQYDAGPTAPPSVVWMIIPGTAKWLKEFFDIHVVVSNLASAPFKFQHGHVSLANLPAGLTLAPTATPQSFTQTMADIPAGSSAELHWVLRGDTEGFYTVNAEYTGTLEPLGAPLDIPIASAPNALHVWGGSALQMIVDVDDTATLGYPYIVNIGLKNVADVPVYNPTVAVSEQGRLNFIYQPREDLEQGTAAIQPGATFTAHYRLVPEISGSLDLSQSFIAKTGGNVDLATSIVQHASTPIGSVPTVTATLGTDGVHLSWQPVAGASKYEIYGTPTRDTPFSATPARTVSGTSAVVPFTVGRYVAISAVTSRNTMVHPLTDWMSAPIDGAVLAREHGSCAACNLAAATQLVKAAMHQAGVIDPVDAGTGFVSTSYQDLKVRGRGPVLSMVHSYGSVFAGDNGPLGYGWSFSYGAHLRVDPSTSDVTVTEESGGENIFHRQGDGSYKAAPRVIATLVKESDGTYTFKRFNQLTIRFDSAGRLTRMEDLNHYATTLSYAAGLLNTVTNASGRALHYTWTGSHITDVRDDSGRHVTFGYDAAGNMVSFVDANGGRTTLGYDPSHRLTTVLDANQYGAPIPHPLTYLYDEQGRVIDQMDPLGRHTTFAYATVDPNTTTTLITDPAGHKTLDRFEFGLRTATTRGYGTADATTTTFIYDPATLGIVRTHIDAPDDPNHYDTSTIYNTAGQPVSQTDALGRTTTTTYNAFNEILSSTTPNPSTTGPPTVTTRFTYDANGNLTSESRLLWTSATASQAFTTSYQHADTAHPEDVTTIIDPLNKKTKIVYLPTGERASVASPKKNITRFTYDALGRLITKVAPRGNVKGANPANFRTTYTFDTLDRIVTTTIANQPANIVTTSHYNLDGDLDHQVDADGHPTDYKYDLAGQLTETDRADGSKLSQDYFGDGTVFHQYDAAHNATTYAYDALARPITTIDPLGRPTKTTYGGVGEVLTKVAADGGVTSYGYDAAGDPTSVNYSDGVTPSVTYRYGPSGLRASMTDGTGTSTYSYDSVGRLLSTTNGSGSKLSYTYNARDQITKTTYPNGKFVTRVFDPDGRTTSIKDWLKHKTKYVYDRDDNITTVKYPNTVVTTNTYDNADRLMGITHRTSASPTPLATFGYTRSTAGLLVGDTHTGVTGANQTYTYDPLNRLSTLDNNTYGFDTADNLTHSVDGAPDRAYDTANQLCWTGTGTGTCPTKPTGATSYAYNQRGDRTGATPATGPAIAVGYDQADRLTNYNGTATYTYNGAGLRSTKKIGATTSTFAWDGAAGLPLVVQDGANSYVYGPDGRPFEQISGAVVQYLLGDQLQSTRAITNAAGSVIGTYRYTPYGELADHSGSASTPFQYNSQYRDSESGLIYLRARYYDPAVGQFTSADPLKLGGQGDYSYAANSPLTESDPTGLWPWDGKCIRNPFGGDGSCTALPINQKIANYGGGVLNTITFGNEKTISGALGIEDHVDRSSAAYKSFGLSVRACVPGDEGGCISGQYQGGHFSVSSGAGGGVYAGISLDCSNRGPGPHGWSNGATRETGWGVGPFGGSLGYDDRGYRVGGGGGMSLIPGFDVGGYDVHDVHTWTW
ncbi:MAG: Ig-like domain repeat protein [Acidimicrobiia bacterium]